MGKEKQRKPKGQPSEYSKDDAFKYFQGLFANSPEPDPNTNTILDEVRRFCCGEDREPGKELLDAIVARLKSLLMGDSAENTCPYSAIWEIYLQQGENYLQQGEKQELRSLARKYCFLHSTPEKEDFPEPDLATLALQCDNDSEFNRKLHQPVQRFLSDLQSSTDYGHIADSIEKQISRSRTTDSEGHGMFTFSPLVSPDMILDQIYESKRKPITPLVPGAWLYTNSLLSINRFNIGTPQRYMSTVTACDIVARASLPNVDWPDRDTINDYKAAQKQRTVVRGTNGKPKLEKNTKQLRLGKGVGEKSQIQQWIRAAFDFAGKGSKEKKGITKWTLADTACIFHPEFITDNSYNVDKYTKSKDFSDNTDDSEESSTGYLSKKNQHDIASPSAEEIFMDQADEDGQDIKFQHRFDRALELLGEEALLEILDHYCKANPIIIARIGNTASNPITVFKAALDNRYQELISALATAYEHSLQSESSQA